MPTASGAEAWGTVGHGSVGLEGVMVIVWANPMLQEGPYPSQARSETLSSVGSVAGQQFQFMARSRESGVMFVNSQYICMTCQRVRTGWPSFSFHLPSHFNSIEVRSVLERFFFV
jgi:hypothetical protein